MDFWVMPLHQPRKNTDNDSLRFLLFHNRADSFFHPGHCPSDCRLSQACLTVDAASPDRVLWLRYAVCGVCPPPPTAVHTKLQWAKCLIESDSAQWGLHGAPCCHPAGLFRLSPSFSERKHPCCLGTDPPRFYKRDHPLHYCYFGAIVVRGISRKPERECAVLSLLKH